MNEIIANVEQLQAVRQAVREQKAKKEADGVVPIRICMGASCIASGAQRVQAALNEQLECQGLEAKAEICEVGCLGPCSAGPVIAVGDVLYENVRAQDCTAIVREHLGRGQRYP